MNHSTTEQLLDANAVAKILDLKPETIRTWARAGRIRFVRIGRSLRFRTVDVSGLMSEMSNNETDEVRGPCCVTSHKSEVIDK